MCRRVLFSIRMHPHSYTLQRPGRSKKRCFRSSARLGNPWGCISVRHVHTHTHIGIRVPWNYAGVSRSRGRIRSISFRFFSPPLPILLQCTLKPLSSAFAAPHSASILQPFYCRPSARANAANPPNRTCGTCSSPTLAACCGPMRAWM